MATIGNNDNAEYARVRDCFLTEGEKEFFKRLLKSSEHERDIHKELSNYSAKFLYEKASAVLNAVESGEMNSVEDMKTAEYLLVHYFSAIQDYQLSKEKEYPYPSLARKQEADDRIL